ncbi:MAG TPA: glycosyltransferase [Vicinamibacterales bacterium]|nr:glycosyltransferase [Vicinamibacterales bacterium]
MIDASRATRVLHVTPYLEPAWAYGPVAHNVMNLARAQVQTGDRASVLTTDALAPHERLPAGEAVVDGVRVVRVRNLSGAARTWLGLSTPPAMGRHLRTLLAERAFDVVHLHELRTVENLVVAAVLSTDVPIVLSPHGGPDTRNDGTWFATLWDATVGDRVLSRVRQFVADTAPEADRIRAWCARRGLHVRPVSVVMEGMDLAAFTVPGDACAARGRFGLHDGPVVLFVGHIRDRRTIQLLIDAFAAALLDHPRAQLLVVGPDHGALTHAQRAVADRDLAAVVRFAGHLGGADLRAAFAAADLLALPVFEPGAAPPLEALQALASGVPVVLRASCNLPVAQRGAGLEVAPDAGAWARAVSSALAAGEERQSAMRDQARALAQEYTWPATAAALKRVYDAARS